MNESRALQLLNRCKPLAQKLTAANIGEKPLEADLKTLEEYEQLRHSQLSYQKLKLLAGQAGISSEDLAMLNWECIRMRYIRNSKAPLISTSRAVYPQDLPQGLIAFQ